jgi:hypothetical protein
MAGAQQQQPGVLHVVLERAFDLKDMDLLHKMVCVPYTAAMDHAAQCKMTPPLARPDTMPLCASRRTPTVC